MLRTLTDHVSWVGKIDWELRKFHGDEYSTHHGTSFNSYLIRDEKTALVDTVWSPFAAEFVENLEKHVDLAEIDYVIVNHAEPDHGGSLSALMSRIPDTPIYCTKNGVNSIRGHHHKDWNFQVVDAGDTLSLGKNTLTFIPIPMLHWPDSMMCHLSGDNVLFSNDAFGQHLASELMFNDLVSQCDLWAEALKYYANILAPFSMQARRKLDEFLSLNIPVSMICPSHGVIWRDNPAQIVEQYMKWADDYQENQITVVYDTMYGATRLMADMIVDGIRTQDPEVEVKAFHSAKADTNDIISEIFKSKAVVMGSPTFNRGFLCSLGALLEEMNGLKFRKKKAATFTSYGWSGEGAAVLAKRLEEAGFEVVGDGLKILWRPDEEGKKQALEFGKKIAESAR